MTDAQMLTALKIDLGITVSAYDTRLQELLTNAKDAIIAEGAESLDPSANFDDAQLVVMYAAWRWQQRRDGGGMPRMLRYALNNRVFGEKAAEGGAGA